MNLLKNVSRAFKRQYCTIQNAHILEKLSNRKIIRVAGNEVTDFLQGLITNDIHHLDHGMGSLYTMFLNTKGRVMYDTLIYKTDEKSKFFIECDSEIIQSLIRHLKMYRVRRKIDIDNLGAEYDVYALFNRGYLKNLESVKDLDGFIVPCDSLNTKHVESHNSTKVVGDLLIYKDPRAIELGSRLLAPSNSDIKPELSKIINFTTTSADMSYRSFRYYLGIGEGVNDLPPNDCFPLEANCDYLHGVSFHKGCYIGQELTARTHHTGVVRKRLMPLIFNEKLTKPPEDNKIIHDKINLGKLRGVEGKVGLGLLRIAQAIETKNIKIGSVTATTGKPNWWPIEAPKEKMSA